MSQNAAVSRLCAAPRPGAWVMRQGAHGSWVAPGSWTVRLLYDSTLVAA